MQFHYHYYAVILLPAAYLLSISTGVSGKSLRAHVEKTVSSRILHKSPSYGGDTGEPFDDIEFFDSPDESPISALLSLNVSSTSFFVDSIQVGYTLANLTNTVVPIRGTSKNPTSIALYPFEYIILIEGSTNGVAVTGLTITKSGPNGTTTYGPFGKPSATEFSFEGYIAGFFGKSESYLTNIGVYYYDKIQKSEDFGITDDGSGFDDHTDMQIPAIVGLSSLTLWHGAFLNGIRAEYIVQGGNKVLGELHGGTGSTLSTTITLKDGDQLEHISFGHTEYGFITLLNFTMKKASGGTEVLGPFGNKGFEKYSFDGNILGFHGHSGQFIYRLGFYYV